MKFLKILLILLSCSHVVFAQNDNTYFVVIGAFRIHDNAARFSIKARQDGLVAQYAFCPAAGLYYVYVLKTNDHEKAHLLTVKMKEETHLKNAWVFTGKLNLVKDAVKRPERRTIPIKEIGINLAHIPPEKSVHENASSLAGKPSKAFYFRVISRPEGKEVIGNLLLQETETTSLYRVIKSGEVVQLQEPQKRQSSYHIIALIPGYKQNSIIFFYFNPPIETGPNNEEIVTLTLEKARSANFIEFSHVQFYENTSSLRAVSGNELDELSYLLTENPNCKISIHGHCKSAPYNLSLARAETVKAYLVRHGIDASRILTRGDEDGSIKNGDGVEVEFLQDVLVTSFK